MAAAAFGSIDVSESLLCEKAVWSMADKWAYMWVSCRKIREKGDVYTYNVQSIDGTMVQEGPLTPFLAWAGDQGWEMVGVGASDVYNGPLTLFFKKPVA